MRCVLALLCLPVVAIPVSASSQVVEPVSLMKAGTSRAVAVRDNILFAGVGNWFIVYDVSDPANPVELFSQDTLVGGSVRDIVLSGDLALIPASAGLVILDVSSPVAPTLIGKENSESAGNVAVAGTTAYVTWGLHGFRTVDVSDPTHPAVLGSTQDVFWPQSVAVVGDHAVTVSFLGDLQVVDVSDPATPSMVSTLKVSANGLAVAAVGSLVLVPADGLVVVDVGDPLAPQIVGRYDSPYLGATSVAVSGQNAFVGGGYYNIEVIDFSSPAAPFRAGVLVGTGAQDLSVENNHLFAADTGWSLRSIDVSSHASPVVTNTVDYLYGTASLHIHGGILYAGGTTVVSTTDISNPYQPLHIQSAAVGDDKNVVWFHNDLLLVGRWDFYPDSNAGGLTILDASSPSALGEFSYGFGWDTTYEIFGREQYVFLLGKREWKIGLAIFDVSNPAAPVELSFTDVGYIAWAFELVGDVAFVAGTSNGLKMYDVSDPASPVLRSTFAGGVVAQDVVVIGDHAFVADPSAGLIVVDVSDPDAPQEVTRLTSVGQPEHIAAHPPHVIIAGDDPDLRIIDVSNPTQPVPVGSFPTGGSSEISVQGQLIATILPDGSVLMLRADVLDPATAVAPSLPRELSLAAYPNPFNPATTIRFTVPRAGPVDLAIFDVRGRRVTTLRSRWVDAGDHSVEWDGRNDRGERVASGVYLCRLRTDGREVTRKLVMVM